MNCISTYGAYCAANTIMRNETNLAIVSISKGVKSEAESREDQKKKRVNPFRLVSRHRGGSLSLFHLKIDWERRKWETQSVRKFTKKKKQKKYHKFVLCRFVRVTTVCCVIRTNCISKSDRLSIKKKKVKRNIYIFGVRIDADFSHSLRSFDFSFWLLLAFIAGRLRERVDILKKCTGPSHTSQPKPMQPNDESCDETKSQHV